MSHHDEFATGEEPRILRHTCITDDGGTPNRRCAACEQERLVARPIGKTGIAIGTPQALDARGWTDKGSTRREGDQQLPVPNALPNVQDMVIADIEARKALGLRRYGTLLQPFNGRDALLDAYQESIDQTLYLRQEIFERTHTVPDSMARHPTDGDWRYADPFGQVWRLRRTGDPSIPFTIELEAR